MTDVTDPSLIESDTATTEPAPEVATSSVAASTSPGTASADPAPEPASKPQVLTREQILQAPDIQQEEVDVPEWGGIVIVRGLTGAERDHFEDQIVSVKQERKKGGGTRLSFEQNMDNVRAKLVVSSVVDEQGKLLFSETDIKALGDKSAAALQRVWEKARELSGLSDDDVDELTTALGNAQSAGSGSS